MKIFYCVRSLDGIPSCIYNIQLIHELGYKVVPVLGSSSKGLITYMEREGITYHLMSNSDKNEDKKGILQRLSTTVHYRCFAKKVINKEFNNNDIVFIGTGDTAVALYNTLKKTKKVLILKELYEIPKYYQLLLKRMSRDMCGIVCCEKNRSRIIKYRWNLSELPYTLPNKPYNHPLIRQVIASSEITKKVINEIKNQKVVLYQARHIHFIPELEKLAHALSNIAGDYLLVLIGTVDNEFEIKKVIDIYPKTYLAGHIPAPFHLEITSYAYIGVAVYQENSLNNLFCAPNKIYEYAGFGIPTLGNDIPGLMDTIQATGAGECVQWDKVKEIENAIKKIESNYSKYSSAAEVFFKNTDCLSIVEQIILNTTQKAN